MTALSGLAQIEATRFLPKAGFMTAAPTHAKEPNRHGVQNEKSDCTSTLRISEGVSIPSPTKVTLQRRQVVLTDRARRGAETDSNCRVPALFCKSENVGSRLRLPAIFPYG